MQMNNGYHHNFCRNTKRIRIMHSKRLTIIKNLESHCIGFLVLIATLAFFTGETVPYDGFDTVKRLVIGIIPCLLVVFSFLHPIKENKGPGFIIYMATLLLLWVWVQWLYRESRWVEIMVQVSWTMPILMFLSSVLQRNVTIKKIIPWFIAAGMIQCVIAFLEYAGWFDEWLGAIPNAHHKMIGSIGYHNQLAAFLALNMGLVWFYVRSTYIKYGVSVLFMLTIMWTGCRGAAFSLVALIVTMIICMKGPVITRRTVLRVCLAATLLLIIIIISPLGHRCATLLQSSLSDASVQSRVIMSRVGIAMWLEQPITGWGGGQYAFQYISRLGDVLSHPLNHQLLSSVVYARESHNDIVQIAAEYGLFGIVLTMLAIGGVFWISFKKRDSAESQFIMYTLLYMILHSLVSFPWQMSMVGPIAGLMIGLSLTSSVNVSSTSIQKSISMGIKCCVLIVSCLCFMLLWSEMKSLICLNRVFYREPDNIEIPTWGYRQKGMLGAYKMLNGDRQQARILMQGAWNGYHDIPLLNNLASTCVSLDENDTALDLYTMWVDSGIGHQQALYNQSVVLEKMKRFEE